MPCPYSVLCSFGSGLSHINEASLCWLIGGIILLGERLMPLRESEMQKIDIARLLEGYLGERCAGEVRLTT
jgi:hypothetical protein